MKRQRKFLGAVFVKAVDFSGSIFKDVAHFEGAAFGARAVFDDCTFERNGDYRNVKCYDKVSFKGAEFKDSGGFEYAQIKGRATLESVDFNEVILAFAKPNLRAMLTFQLQNSKVVRLLRTPTLQNRVALMRSNFRRKSTLIEFYLQAPRLL
jgi:hypothetical protein